MRSEGSLRYLVPSLSKAFQQAHWPPWMLLAILSNIKQRPSFSYIGRLVIQTYVLFEFQISAILHIHINFICNSLLLKNSSPISVPNEHIEVSTEFGTLDAVLRT